jgi:hypothetical protein
MTSEKYSAYETCISAGCNCDHHNGIWRAQHVNLGDAFRSLHRAAGYESHIVNDATGEDILLRRVGE